MDKKLRKRNKNNLTYSKEYFSGPIPHPAIFQKYEEVLPGSADRLLAMAENQSRHRQDLEQKVVISNIEAEKQGMNYAFWLTVLLSIIGAVLIAMGRNIEGLVALFGPNGFHVANYIFQKILARKEQDETPEKE